MSPLTHQPRRPAGAPDQALVLYEHACDLLLAARGLRATAGRDGTLPAVAATLGCLETTIDALADAIERLRVQAAEQVRQASGGPPAPEALDAARRIARDCDDAARTLRVARDMTGGIRERVGPALAELAA